MNKHGNDDAELWRVSSETLQAICGISGRDLNPLTVMGGIGIALFTLWEARQLLLQARAVRKAQSVVGVDLFCFSYLFFYNTAVLIYGWYGGFRPLIWHALILLVPYSYLSMCLFRYRQFNWSEFAQIALSSSMIPILLGVYTFGPLGNVTLLGVGPIKFGIEFFFLLFSSLSLMALYRQDRTLIRTIRTTGGSGILRPALIATFVLSNGSWLIFALGSEDPVLMVLSWAGLCICFKTLYHLVEQRKAQPLPRPYPKMIA